MEFKECGNIMRMVKKRKVKCDECGGKGWKVDHMIGIGTLGLGYLVQAVGGKLTSDDDCPKCNGKGYVIEEEEYEII